ncbi:hypothetical protein [Malaciobacter canalis]|nr:hypothetical protein [Malaciobacter canalis]
MIKNLDLLKDMPCDINADLKLANEKLFELENSNLPEHKKEETVKYYVSI